MLGDILTNWKISGNENGSDDQVLRIAISTEREA